MLPGSQPNLEPTLLDHVGQVPTSEPILLQRMRMFMLIGWTSTHSLPKPITVPGRGHGAVIGYP